ncbi:hypothetical protein D9M68_811440 [compost metagenome]
MIAATIELNTAELRLASGTPAATRPATIKPITTWTTKKTATVQIDNPITNAAFDITDELLEEFCNISECNHDN